MDSDGNSKDDVKIPETDIGKEIQSSFDDGKDLLVTIIAAMGEHGFLSVLFMVGLFACPELDAVSHLYPFPVQSSTRRQHYG